MSIFVQIASYRDPELKPTIKSVIENAQNPDKLTFGICWQHGDDENLDEYKNDPRFRIMDVYWEDSKGLGWARSKIQKLYANETYTMQLDSHHRFIKNWDTELIKMYKQLQEKGYKKPILTTYAAVYDPEEKEIYKTSEPYIMRPDRFTPYGTIMFYPYYIPNYKDLNEPLRARFVSGHFFFTTGLHCKEYKYDPEVYFAGDEISLSIRSFTLGYDLFHPHKLIMWHHYGRNYRRKHWDDHSLENKENKVVSKTWYERDEYSKQRIRQLLKEEDHGIDLGRYGLGKARTHKDYELYAGINFKERKLQKYTLDGKEPPNPTKDVVWETDGEKGEENEYEVTVKWNIDEIEKCDDMQFWYIGILDKNDVEIYRKDLTFSENKDILTKNAQYVIKLITRKIPYKYKIWPYSVSKKWLKAIDKVIPQNDIYLVK